MRNRQVLIKYGGNAMLHQDLKLAIAKQIRLLYDHDVQVILVHGGGPFINEALEKAGVASEFIEGHRYTSKEAIPHVEAALKGIVNGDLVGLLNKQGLSAVGLSGKDGKTVTAKKRWHQTTKAEKIDLGYVGDVSHIDTTLLEILLKNRYVPVLACVAPGDAGEVYNINADMFAGHLAARLAVDDYIVLTDVDGLYQNFPDPGSIITSLELKSLQKHYESTIKGGMIPKIESCEIALKGGAARAVILNGTKPHQIEDYLLKQKPIGTSIVR